MERLCTPIAAAFTPCAYALTPVTNFLLPSTSLPVPLSTESAPVVRLLLLPVKVAAPFVIVSRPSERLLRPEVRSFIPLVSFLLFAVRAFAPLFKSLTPLINAGISPAASDKEPVFAANFSKIAACVCISFKRVSISPRLTFSSPSVSLSALGASPNAFLASPVRPLILILSGSTFTLTLLSIAFFNALFISGVKPSISTLSIADLAAALASAVALLLIESFLSEICLFASSVALLSTSSNAFFALLNFSETLLLCASIFLLYASTAADS